MRESSGDGRVCAVIILFVLLFGCLVLHAQCRPSLPKDGGERKSYPDSGVADRCPESSAVSSTSSDESKLRLVLCFYKGLRCVVGEPCHCCRFQQPEPQCYCTHDECVAKCPFCYPDCPPEVAMEGRPSRAMINATLY